jgi:hypothetical protein
VIYLLYITVKKSTIVINGKYTVFVIIKCPPAVSLFFIIKCYYQVPTCICSTGRCKTTRLSSGQPLDAANVLAAIARDSCCSTPVQVPGTTWLKVRYQGI